MVTENNKIAVEDKAVRLVTTAVSMLGRKRTNNMTC